jgi:hypothetical protein
MGATWCLSLGGLEMYNLRILQREIAAARRANHAAINLNKLGFYIAAQETRGVRASHMRAARRIREWHLKSLSEQSQTRGQVNEIRN